MSRRGTGALGGRLLECRAPRTRTLAAPALVALAVAALAVAFQPRVAPWAAAQGEPPGERVAEVIATYPHDPTAYTQGLLLHEGRLYESTGKYGASTLRRVRPETGEVELSRDLDAAYFAEGLARVGERLLQLTWREGTLLTYDLSVLAPSGEIDYEGEGWGLCHDGSRLVMSDGSAELIFRDPVTFAETGRVLVTLNGQPVARLNELECVEGAVYANVWTETYILRIDPATGVVTERIDASAIDRSLRERYNLPSSYDCLNGIAWIPDSDRFYITGKHWPELYEVRFVPAGATPDPATPVPPRTETTTPASPTPSSGSSATPSATPASAPLYLPSALQGR